MPNLTRIKNNQITDSTIYANAKIVPGSIVGSLFNSNITVTSDFLITGNLTVLGNSTVTTVASTNTFVNDPLIVLNNAFSGTNTYDLGLIFNRGSSTNQAFIWNEFNQEFRLLATSETGATYGNIVQSSYANIRLGNLTVQYDQSARNVTLSGDIAVNGGDITTSASTFNLLNTTATTLNVGGAATILNLGASTGYTNIASGNIYLPNAANIATTQATVAVFNTDSTAVNAFGAATQMTLGATTGTANIRNANIWFPNATTVGSAQSTVTLFSLPSTIDAFGGALTMNAGGSATLVNIGATSGATIINSGNLWLPYAANIGGTQSTVAVFNTNATTVDAFGAATTLTLGASGAGSTANIRSANIFIPNATTIYSGQPTLTIANTNVTTLSIGGATTVMNVGGSSGTTNLLGAVTIQSTAATTTPTSGALVVNGGVAIAGDLRLAGNLYLANIIGTVTNTISVQDPLLYLESGNSYPYNYDIGFYSGYTGGPANAYVHTGLVRNDSDYQWYLVGNIGEPSAGQFSTTNAIYETLVLGNLYLRTADALNSDQTTINAFNANVTTFNLAGAATTVTIGAATGTANIRNANVYLPNASTIFTGQTAVEFANTVATTLNIGGSATGLNLGAANSGTTSIRNAANIQSTTTSTTPYTGALKVTGGVGLQGNLNIKGGQYLTMGIDILSGQVFGSAGVVPMAQFVANCSANSRVITHNTIGANTVSTGFAAIADSGNTTQYYVDFGINSSGLTNGLIKPYDGFLYVIGGGDTPGNLNIGAGANVRFYSGDPTSATAEVARIDAPTRSLTVSSTTQAISTSTGALVVTGGAGIGGNIWVANGAIINNSQTSNPFQVKGKLTTSLIYADSNYGALIFGGSNTTPQLGSVVKFNSTDTVLLPVGSTAQRPSNTGNVDIAGMVRYNNTIGTMEFYDGGQWQVTGSVFTVISDRQYSGNTAFGNVDGVNTTFTLQGNATTAATIISINGVMQFPVLAYSVTDTTLEFTEAPAIGDVIDARILTTTQSVSQIASGNGYNQFVADSAGASIWTGTSATTQRVLVDPVGNFNFHTGNKITYTQTAVNIPTAGNATLLDTWSVSSYGTAKYIIQIRNSTDKVESMEALVAAEGSNASVTTYAVINSHGTAMGTLTANVVSGNCRLYYTSTSLSNSNVKVMTTLIV